MKVKLLDLVPQYESIKEEVHEALDDVLSSQRFILGPKVEELEAMIGDLCGVGHAVGVASGSDAILISLMALGIGPGDEVITTPYTFFSTVSSITRLGAKPVFVDIERATYNIDPSAVDAAITERTKAILVVHLFGQSAEMKAILSASERRGIPVIEDACQSIGASYGGRMVGSMGTAGCFSFFPSKNLGGYGDGGMIVTGDADFASEARLLRVHGGRDRYYHDVIGLNSRLDALQAAVLLVKLGHLGEWNDRRRENAAYYSEGLSGADGIEVPYIDKDAVHVFNQYVIRSADRDGLRSFLSEAGVGCEVYYPVPLHMQRCFSFLDRGKGDFPEAERAALQTLAIPVYPEISRAEQDYVIGRIRRFTENIG